MHRTSWPSESLYRIVKPTWEGALSALQIYIQTHARTQFLLYSCFVTHFLHLLISFLSFYLTLTLGVILSVSLCKWCVFTFCCLHTHALYSPRSFNSDVWPRVRFTCKGTQEAAYFRDGQPAVIYWALTLKWQSVLLHRSCVCVWLVCEVEGKIILTRFLLEVALSLITL